MALIKLGRQDIFAEVDDEDYEFLMQWSWYGSRKYRKTNDQTVPRRSTRVKGRVVAVYMHRVIAERKGLDVKNNKVGHLDDNTLNNRRINIGYKNSSPRRRSFESTGKVITAKSSFTGHPGISFNAGTEKYVARAVNKTDRITVKVGDFDTLEEAIYRRNEFLKNWDGFSGSNKIERLHSV